MLETYTLAQNIWADITKATVVSTKGAERLCGSHLRRYSGD